MLICISVRLKAHLEQNRVNMVSTSVLQRHGVIASNSVLVRSQEGDMDYELHISCSYVVTVAVRLLVFCLLVNNQRLVATKVAHVLGLCDTQYYPQVI